MKTLSEDRIAAVESAEVIFESAAFLAVFFFFKLCILLSSFLSFHKMHKIATLSHTYVCMFFVFFRFDMCHQA